MTKPRIILVPGFWLGAWAWDEVAKHLRSKGHDVTPMTLPGLETRDEDRSSITFEDHVNAVAEVVEAGEGQVVLAVHSGAGGVGHAVSDRLPDRIFSMVYVDTGAADGPLDPDFSEVEMPLPSTEELSENENLDGLTDEHLDEFQRRGVPEPGGAVREGPVLTNDDRLDIPSFVLCTGFTSDQYKDAVKEGYSFLAGLADLNDLTYVDMPTSHWPMWSRPETLAEVIDEIARGDKPGARPAADA